MKPLSTTTAAAAEAEAEVGIDETILSPKRMIRKWTKEEVVILTILRSHV
jgi:hypothetical protein